MRHVEKALIAMANTNELAKYIKINNAEDVKGVCPTVCFTIQSDPVSEVGVNGCQATDMLEYVKNLFISLNSAIPNEETTLTITLLNTAIEAQHERTKNRISRGVEGEQTK